MTYELKEYSQEPSTDQNPYPDTFTNKNFPLFYHLDELIKYIKKNSIYGKVFEYDDMEYAEYHNSDDDCMDVEIPEPTNEWNTEELIGE